MKLDLPLAAGALTALVVTTAWAGSAAAAPNLTSVSNDAEPAGMYQGRVLTYTIGGTDFGTAKGTVRFCDVWTGVCPYSVGPAYAGMTWSDTSISIEVSEQFTATYEPKAYTWAIEVVRADGAASNRRSTSYRIWSVPRRDEWTRYAPATTGLLPGESGQWDKRLNGAVSPATAVKKGGTFYLYYVGATGDRDDGGPANRGLGVATSTDGIHYTKVGKIISVPGSDEAGVFSAAAVVDAGQVVLYYSRCRDVGGIDVACDVYRATSNNGINFTGHVKVFDAGDVESGGNEVFPVGVIHDGVWVVTYTWKDGKANVHLSSAWSSDGATSWASGRLLDNDDAGGVVNSPLVGLPGNHTLLLGTRSPKSWPDFVPDGIVELHSSTSFRPLGRLPFEYDFSGSPVPALLQATTLFDPATRTWYLYALEHKRSESCGQAGAQALCHRARGISVRTYTSVSQ